jgi:DNA polymerase
VQFNGAGRSGRFSHRLFQPGNMSRPVLTVRKEFGPDAGKVKLEPVKAKYIDEVIMPGIRSKDALQFKEVYGGPNEAAALALRHVIKAAIGNELVVADWSNIESRVLAWIADETWKLEAYRARDRGEGEDLYRLLFSSFFGVDPKAVNDTERQSGKVSELAFGFGGGVGALVTMAAGYQMDLDPIADIVLPRATPDQMHRAHKAWRRAFLLNEDYGLDSKVFKACDILKQTYREANAKIDQLKHDVDKAVKAAIREPGRWFHLGRCTIWCDSAWLIIQLPSGRRLLYSQPKIETEIDVDPDTLKPIHREFISYSTARHKSWIRERAWSGLFIENIVQAIANDVLRAGLLALHKDTFTVPAVRDFLMSLPPDERTAISLHVHDEAILDVPKGSYPLIRMLRLLGQSPRWGEGLPLVAEGWVGPVYGKREGKNLNQLLRAAA